MKSITFNASAIAATDLALPASPHFEAIAISTLQQHACDEHWQVIDDQTGAALARASLWWENVPSVPDEKLGVIGHFAAAFPEASSELLNCICRRLKELGCTLAVGPMDGNTWRKYRFVTDIQGNLETAEPLFFLEPHNPAIFPTWFEASGFESFARYTSSLITDLTKEDPRVARANERLQGNGIVIKPLEKDKFDQDLEAVYHLSCQSFTQNFLYTPISLGHFLKLYQPLREKMVPELVQLAWHEDKLAGYLFGIPDFAQLQRGQQLDTAIAKTLAILPGKTYGGLGAVLTNVFHRNAHALGYKRCIHALAYEGNGKAQHLTAFFGTVMRHYTLFSRRL
ncbi:MAG TPA: hypothetical protein VK970_24710 [Candidatus Methylacidiphilales bacterium]|nr:hypothetical protein [Candidatus Methylacidiphilales bacterium]